MTCQAEDGAPVREDETMTLSCQREEGHDGLHWDGLLYTWEDESN